jgi:hypothetical protein
VRAFVASSHSLCESALSLAPKVGVSPGHCRRILEVLVSEGSLRRREFGDIEPIYYRYANR